MPTISLDARRWSTVCWHGWRKITRWRAFWRWSVQVAAASRAWCEQESSLLCGTGRLPGSAEWPIVTLLPGSLPFDELEIALRRAFPALSPTLFSDSRDDASSLLRTLRLCLPNDRVELLLVIDQFEEVFTLVSDPDEARRFLDGLYWPRLHPTARYASSLPYARISMIAH